MSTCLAPSLFTSRNGLQCQSPSRPARQGSVIGTPRGTDGNGGYVVQDISVKFPTQEIPRTRTVFLFHLHIHGDEDLLPLEHKESNNIHHTPFISVSVASHRCVK